MLAGMHFHYWREIDVKGLKRQCTFKMEACTLNATKDTRSEMDVWISGRLIERFVALIICTYLLRAYNITSYIKYINTLGSIFQE